MWFDMIFFIFYKENKHNICYKEYQTRMDIVL